MQLGRVREDFLEKVMFQLKVKDKQELEESMWGGAGHFRKSRSHSQRVELKIARYVEL